MALLYSNAFLVFGGALISAFWHAAVSSKYSLNGKVRNGINLAFIIWFLIRKIYGKTCYIIHWPVGRP